MSETPGMREPFTYATPLGERTAEERCLSLYTAKDIGTAALELLDRTVAELESALSVARSQLAEAQKDTEAEKSVTRLMRETLEAWNARYARLAAACGWGVTVNPDRAIDALAEWVKETMARDAARSTPEGEVPPHKQDGTLAHFDRYVAGDR